MSKYKGIKSKEVVIDTGPLLAILAGFYGRNTTKKFGYTDDDLTVLREFLKNFSKIFVTLQVLAEISNLANTRIEKNFSDFINFSKNMLQGLKEEYIPKDDILSKKELPKFGFTDASLLETVKDNNNRLLLTHDDQLSYYCKNNGIHSASLNEIKTNPYLNPYLKI